MKFSLFFEMQIAEPTRETESRLFHDCVQQGMLADTLGYECLWAVEHHGLYEYSHSSAPEVFLAFMAARTERIRLGHGITLLPHRYNHPIRIAERIATLDILSNGRVNWGSGKSGSRTEQEAFENEVETLHEQWLEAVEMIPRMWATELFSHTGRFFTIPPTPIIPKPVQQPCPPMFAACTHPDSAVFVGGLGMGALNFALGSDQQLSQKIGAYRDAVAQATPQGRPATNHFACTPATLVLADDAKACRYGLRGTRFFRDSLHHYYKDAGPRTRPVKPVAQAPLASAARAPARPKARAVGGFPALALGGLHNRASPEAPPLKPLPIARDPIDDNEINAFVRSRNQSDSAVATLVGDPMCARETVQRFVDAGVDELILLMQLGTVPNELVMESIRTFGEQVMPHF